MISLPRLGLLCLLLAACAPASTPPADPVTPSPPANTLPPGFDVQGHRGARGLRPENTLPAFETALDLGVTTLELDLHYTADRVLVIWHDPAISAAKCGLDPAAAAPLPPDPDSPGLSPSALHISQLTFEQLQKYRCDRNPDQTAFPEQRNDATRLAGDDYGIASLDELFDFVEAYGALETQFNIETKRKPDDPEAINDGFDGVQPGPFEAALFALIEARGLLERVTVQSFDHRSLWAMRQLHPTLRLAALTTGRADPAAYARQGAAIWSPRASDLSPALLDIAHGAGLKVVPWTVNEPGAMRRLIEMGVDGLITDRPDVLLALP